MALRLFPSGSGSAGVFRTELARDVRHDWRMRHLMFEADQGAAPGVWGPGWVMLGGSYPVTELSERLAEDMTTWVDDYERAFLRDDHRDMGDEWHRRGYLLAARANAELMPLGYALWPAFEWTPNSLVPRNLRADFREDRLVISEARMQRLVESSNNLLAAHYLPLIPATTAKPA
jgi:hypothetical protein